MTQITKQTAVDVASGTVTYYGEAELGRATTDAKWTIKKVEVSGGITTTKYPIGSRRMPSDNSEFAWDDRATYTYSFVPDVVAPTLSVVTIASNNSTTTLAKVGDIVTLSITSSEALSTISATIMGQVATIIDTGLNTWTASYTMATGDTEGAVTFAINFSDMGGIPGTAVTVTTNASAVTFDKTVLASDTNLTAVNTSTVISETVTIATEPVKVTVGNSDIGGAVVATTVIYATTIDVTGTSSATANQYT